MAKFEEVRLGDKLRIDMEVISIETTSQIGSNGARVKAPGGSEHFVGIKTIMTAEHIPAPRYFKRGEFVRSLVSRVDRGGLVVGRDINGEVWVTWPGNERYQPVPLPSETLEHDEAPE